MSPRRGGLKARFNRRATGCLDRAYSPLNFLHQQTWAVGPGWYEHGPLALKRRLGLVGKDKR